MSSSSAYQKSISSKNIIQNIAAISGNPKIDVMRLSHTKNFTLQSSNQLGGSAVHRKSLSKNTSQDSLYFNQTLSKLDRKNELLPPLNEKLKSRNQSRTVSNSNPSKNSLNNNQTNYQATGLSQNQNDGDLQIKSSTLNNIQAAVQQQEVGGNLEKLPNTLLNPILTQKLNKPRKHSSKNLRSQAKLDPIIPQSYLNSKKQSENHLCVRYTISRDSNNNLNDINGDQIGTNTPKLTSFKINSSQSLNRADGSPSGIKLTQYQTMKHNLRSSHLVKPKLQESQNQQTEGDDSSNGLQSLNSSEKNSPPQFNYARQFFNSTVLHKQQDSVSQQSLIANKFKYGQWTIAGKSSGKTKQNQDRVYFKQNFFDAKEDSKLLIIADGHGPNGDHVSEAIIQIFPYLLKNELQGVFDQFNMVDESTLVQSTKYHLEMKTSIQKSFKKLNQQINHSQFDVLLSGSTLTVIVQINQFVYSANVGDSRAILLKSKKPQVDLYQSKIFEGEAFQLSTDHKPSEYQEKIRIQKMKGEVKQSYSQKTGKYQGAHRVWIQDKDFPGLAMSRSIGDKLAHTVGVIPTPDVTIYKINRDDYEYVIVSASDGIWDAMETKEVRDYIQINRFQSELQVLCKNIAINSRDRWLEWDHNTVDDITIQILELN
eukprot:403358187